MFYSISREVLNKTSGCFFKTPACFLNRCCPIKSAGHQPYIDMLLIMYEILQKERAGC